MDIICTLLLVYLWAIIARIVLGYFQVPYDHPVGQIRRLVGRIVDPAMEPLRRVLPPVPLGAVRLDLSPIVLIIGIQILMGIIC